MATFRPEHCHVALQICQMGGTDLQLASALGATLVEVKRWQIKYPQFGEACRVGSEAANHQIVRSLYHTAKGYDYDAVRHDKVKVDGVDEIVETEYLAHVPGKFEAQKYWLENKDPDNWSSKTRTEITGKDGQPLTTERAVMIDPEDLTDEQLEKWGEFFEDFTADEETNSE